ncbi:carbon storage regulator [Paenibacillus agaridevorans]|uniref:Translational regulator CsrA n=1 Tax=Paenibacillus agaridevorans TaxID=171404 RepID=A0A2R5EM60_9BACL|nr:carbon storage regulator CsrA [Paenibacillus agaridevorans]GBG07195.1 carbon storage regulator [Paenibacillus agaridevorans]
MLVLSRKAGSSLMIGDGIEITVLDITNDVVKIGITAPKEIQILRKELYTLVEDNNRSAETSSISKEDLLKQFKEMKNIKKL